MKSIRYLRYLLVLPLLLAACSKSGGGGGGGLTPIEPLNQKPGYGNMVVMGDSLAFGTGATDITVSPTGCLNLGLPGGGVTNIAVEGTTSEEIKATVDAALAVNPKLVFISAGGNDAILTAKGIVDIPDEVTLVNMNAIFDRLLAAKALVVYLGLNPPFPQAARMTDISALAASKGVLVVDGMKDFWTDASLMSDQFHPNDKGYAIMCDRMKARIRPYYIK